MQKIDEQIYTQNKYIELSSNTISIYQLQLSIYILHVEDRQYAYYLSSRRAPVYGSSSIFYLSNATIYLHSKCRRQIVREFLIYIYNIYLSIATIYLHSARRRQIVRELFKSSICQMLIYISTFYMYQIYTQGVLNIQFLSIKCNYLSTFCIYEIDSQRTLNIQYLSINCNYLSTFCIQKIDNQGVLNTQYLSIKCNYLSTFCIHKIDSQGTLQIQYLSNAMIYMHSLFIKQIIRELFNLNIQYISIKCNYVSTLYICIEDRQLVSS